MTEQERLAAVDALTRLKARYFRGVDTGDADLVRSILAEDCELDYRGCCTDPATGRDFLPQMNVVLRGRAAWSSDAITKAGIVSVHQGHNAEIDITSATTATAIWSMTDRLYMPPGGPFSMMLGFGYYHESYEKIAGEWQVKTIRITRLRVEAS